MLVLAPRSAFARELYPDSPVQDPDEDPQYLSVANAPPSSLWALNHMPYKRTYRSRPYRRTRRGKFSRRRGARTSLKRKIAQVLMKKAETKYYDIAFENRQLYHNLGSEPAPPGVVIPVNVTSSSDWFNPWLKIQNTGATATQRMGRIGDRITPRGMSLKLYLASKEDRPNTMFRLIVAILPKEVNGTVTTNVFDPFQIANNGSNGNNMIPFADADIGVKFLYDKIIRVGNQDNDNAPTSRKEQTRIVRLWIKRKRSRDIVFSTTSTSILNKPLAVYCIPYEQYSTLTTDRVGSWAGQMRMYYKDV